MKIRFLIMALLVLPLVHLVAEGMFDDDDFFGGSNKRGNADVDSVMGIFDENYQFLISGAMKVEDYYDFDFDYEDLDYYGELYLNNDFLFCGNLLLYYGGEKIDPADLKHYNIVISVPKDVYDEFKDSASISKADLMKLLELPHKAQTLIFDTDLFDIDIKGVFASNDMENYLEAMENFINIFGEASISDTMQWDTLRYEEEVNPISFMLALLLLATESMSIK